MDSQEEKLNCSGYFVKLFDTYSRTFKMGCQRKVISYGQPTHFCIGTSEAPYVIVFKLKNMTFSNTYYKLCCPTSECIENNPFTPFERYGSKNISIPINDIVENMQSFENFMAIIAAFFLVLIIIYPLYYVTIVRAKELRGWAEPPDKIEPALMLLAENPPITTIRYGIGETNTLNGEHKFLDYCRMNVAQNERELKVGTLRPKTMTGSVEDMEQKMNQLYYFNLESSGMGHLAFPVNQLTKTIYHPRIFDTLFWHGPYAFPWTPQQLILTFSEAGELFMHDSIRLDLKVPIVIIGDIRGRYLDLHRWIQAVGLPYRKRILFLGGLIEVDRTAHEMYSIECLAFVAAMKIAYPKHVYMLRGANETVFSFPERFGSKMDLAVLASARQMCSYLPLAAYIEDQYLVVPSGFNQDIVNDVSCFESIKRPLKPDTFPEIVRYLLFGQPTATTKIFEYDEEKGWFIFGMQAVLDLCQNMGIKRIIRARNELSQNPLFLCNAKLLSIYSVPSPQVPGTAVYINSNVGTVIFKLKYQTTDIVKPVACAEKKIPKNKQNYKLKKKNEE